MTETVVYKPKTAPGRHRPSPIETVNNLEGEEHEVEVAGVVVDAVEEAMRRTRRGVLEAGRRRQTLIRCKGW